MDERLPTPDAVEDERRRARRVRLIVDVTSAIIAQGGLERRAAEGLVALARSRILDLFPGRDETYEIIYARRFHRLLEQCAPQTLDGPKGVVVAFPATPPSR